MGLAADALPDWLRGGADWSLFATYTWDPRKGKPPRTAEQVQQEVRSYLRRLDRAGRPVSSAITFSERHSSGYWHGHGLLSLPIGVLRGDIKALHREWFSQKGYIRLEQPVSAGAVSRYLAKYLTKRFTDWSIWPDPSPGSLGPMFDGNRAALGHSVVTNL